VKEKMQFFLSLSRVASASQVKLSKTFSKIMKIAKVVTGHLGCSKKNSSLNEN